MAKVFTNLQFKLDKTQKKVIVSILAVTVPLFFFSLFFIQDTASRELIKFSEQKASHVSTQIVWEIKRYLNDSSDFTREAASMLRLNPDKYTAVLPFLKENIRKNTRVYGSALAIEPSSRLQKTYCKYFYEHNDTVKEKWLIPPAYDYIHKEWYSEVKEKKKGIWSKPYFDKGGGEVFMSTFSYPILDEKNHFLGAVTADIEIEILSRKIQKMSFSKEVFVFIVDKNGLLLSHPDKKYTFKKSAFDYAREIGSQTLLDALHQMFNTDRKTYTVTIASETYTLYSSSIPNSDMKIAVFLKNSLIYKSFNELKQKLSIISLIGISFIILMVIFILQTFQKDIVKKIKLKNELELAKKIQISFLPKDQDVQTSRYEIHSYLNAAKEVGGDLYGYKEQENSIVFYIGDVSGKGIPAALFMMATQIVLENTIETTSDPAEIITLTNNKLLEMSENGMFATLLVIRYDFSNRTLTFCNAGHPPFIVKGKELFSPIPTLHPPVNTFGNIIYTNNILTLQDPFQLICFSDGVTEAENSQKELFGIAKVAKSLTKGFGVDYLLKEIEMHVDGNPQNDDITILAFQVIADTEPKSRNRNS